MYVQLQSRLLFASATILGHGLRMALCRRVLVELKNDHSVVLPYVTGDENERRDITKGRESARDLREGSTRNSEDTANLVLLVKEMGKAFGTKYGLSSILAPVYWYLRGTNLQQFAWLVHH